MDIAELSHILKENGVVGAGGAGFPTYGKLSDKADTILMNCAECEPLLKLHRQLLAEHAKEILQAFDLIQKTLGAHSAIIGVKEEYRSAIHALEEHIGEYPAMHIHKLPGIYPAGDEVVLIYETTKRVIRPGGLPIESGVAVFNVETLYNVYRAVWKKEPVTDKLVTVAGEVEHPVTVRVPIGMKIKDVVALAGRITTENPVYLLGGPMMGNFGKDYQPVTKTTSAVIVLPGEHTLFHKKNTRFQNAVARAASSCCQCQTCTDLCSRHALGHPIEPHLFMRAAANRDFQSMEPFLNTMFCSSCGLCELYSCPQGLSPRSMIAEYKAGLRKAGVKPPMAGTSPVQESRRYRLVPEERLIARLGLTKYDIPAPLIDTSLTDVSWKDAFLQAFGQNAASLGDAFPGQLSLGEKNATVETVKILLSQHIGAPACAVVKEGDTVEAGQVIGQAAQGLSVNIHSSIKGVVEQVTGQYILVRRIAG